jgi:hypothetical protein
VSEPRRLLSWTEFLIFLLVGVVAGILLAQWLGWLG